MIVTRFAPSPTGYMHIGGLRTALFNFLYARANNGKFLLRIEDTDTNRNNRNACKAIIDAFRWTGLEYDNEEIIYQSKRIDIYKQYINYLLDNKLAYYCYMSKEELENLRETQKRNKESPRYDNRYRDFHGEPPKGIDPVIRIKSPLDGCIRFIDKIKGEITINAKEIDDFIIARSDGTPTYNFVVAVDDALMGITDIIRGDDHLSNTPKQIIIYNALGFEIPRFCHVPMITNSHGKKLSKRDGALDVMEYKKMGFLPEALLNFLLRLGFSHGDREIFNMQEMVELFDLNHLSSSPSSYNESKLLWLNHIYMKDFNDIERNLSIDINISDERKEILFLETKKRSNTLIELKEAIESVINAPKSYEEGILSKINIDVLNLLPLAVNSINSFDEISDIDQSLKQFAKNNNIKIGAILTALRCALLGRAGGIGVNETIMILGKNEVENRIEKLKELYTSPNPSNPC